MKKTAEEWEPILQSADVPCARLRSLPEALDSDQVKKTVMRIPPYHYIQTLDDGTKVPTLPFRLGSIKQYKPNCDAPRLGENNHEVREWLADKLAGKALK